MISSPLAPIRAFIVAAMWLMPSLTTAAPATKETPRCEKEAADAGRAVTETLRKLAEAYADALPGPHGLGYRDRQVDAILAGSVDLETFAARVLRQAWTRAGEATRQRWRKALGGMLHRKYRLRLGRPDRVRARLIEATSTCLESVVALRLTQLSAEGMPRSTSQTTLRLRIAKERWRVYDVKVGEVSLLATWRSRFRRIFQNGGLAEVDRELQLMAQRYPCRTTECRLFQTP